LKNVENRKNKKVTILKNKSLTLIISIVAFLLLIPLIAMQFTNEVNWDILDFIVAAILLLSTGLACNFIIQKIKNTKFRIAICLAIVVTFLLIWTELAVGIF
jgi:asparagine N-glycosylation enzyme membrane subunit Stt3